MTYEVLVQEIRALPVEKRKALLWVIADSLTELVKSHRLSEFEGVGQHISDNADAQTYVDELRREWDDRP